MRRVVFTLHLTLALVAGLFVFILGLTGAIMAFEPEIDRLTHGNLVYVTPGASPLPLADIGAAVLKAYPGAEIRAYRVGLSPDESVAVAISGRNVYLDPYTGRILGERQDGRTLLGVIHQIHLRLALMGVAGDPGKSIMSWAGVVILVLAVSGLVLWWPAKRMRIDPRAHGRRFWFDVHSTLGIVSLVFLLALTVTGIAIGFDGISTRLLKAFTRVTPPAAGAVDLDALGSTLNAAMSSEGALPGATPPIIRPFVQRPQFAVQLPHPPHSLEDILTIAREAIPGAKPFSIGLPQRFGVYVYVVRMRFPEDLTPGGRSMVMIQQNGEILSVENARAAPGVTRLITLNRAIHTGDVFGMPSKIVMSLASLALAIQVAVGFMMWIKRRAGARDPAA